MLESKRPGLTIERYFTKDGKHPYDSVEWEFRTAEITNADGSVVFRQEGVEFPKSWSQQATNVVAQKYFRVTGDGREFSVRQMVNRVADTIWTWGTRNGYFATNDDSVTFQLELTHLLLHQMMAFNSPVWFNVGVKDNPQCSACFINSVEDTMESILDLAKTEGMLFKGGSGTGTNLSNLRSSQEKLSGGGTASGPVSFMRGFDAFAGAIKSGGTTRRAAKMVILDVDHPDIVQFIECKAKEEEKAHALIDAGYDGGFNVPGGAYDTVGYQNANHSVRVSDEFMQAVEDDDPWCLRANETLISTHDARDLLRKMAEAAWSCGDPGIQYDDTINAMHTCPNSGRINASNPCSEYMFLDDSACNLASLNLMRFRRDDGSFDVEAFKHAIRITITAMEIIVGNSSYPTEKIRQNSHDYRPLGLGYANLGALLMVSGLPYDSEPGRAYAAAITSLMCGEAYAQSSRIARDVTGPFAGFEANREAMLSVISAHSSRLHTITPSARYEGVWGEAASSWVDAKIIGREHGFRNAQATVLAPTGTIAFLMDCDTTGIEPDIALVKYKRLVGGGMIKIVNQCVPEALRKLGYNEACTAVIVAHIEETGTIEGAPRFKPEHLPVFDCAFKPEHGTRSISPMGHLRMMAAVQPFLSGAISKTVNLPSNCTVEDIESVYMDAWKMGIKAVAVYRDGCKRTQPLSTTDAGASSNGRAEASSYGPGVVERTSEAARCVQASMDILTGPPSATRVKLSSERNAVTHRFSIGGHKGYVTVGLYENGQPGEIFVKMAKEGSTVSGLMDSFATVTSLALQHGVPLRLICDKLKGTRFEPAGFTGNEEVQIATSIVDYLSRWLMLRYSGAVQEVIETELVVEKTATARLETDAPPCHECGTIMVRNGSCHRCPNCGATSGCS